MGTSVYDFTPLDGKGQPFPLADLKGQVLLIVNVASKCGFTPQYKALEQLYQKYRHWQPDNTNNPNSDSNTSSSGGGGDASPTASVRGNRFTILGFPCNQFGAQEPGSDDDIQQFCRANYGVSFPVLAKVKVNGSGSGGSSGSGDDAEAPLYAWLKQEKPGIMGLRRVKWNFEKFLVAADGARVVDRWASTTKPDSLERAIEAELRKAAGQEKQQEGTSTT